MREDLSLTLVAARPVQRGRALPILQAVAFGLSGSAAPHGARRGTMADVATVPVPAPVAGAATSGAALSPQLV